MQLLDVLEHMFDRLGYAESKLQKVRGAIEGFEDWVIENGDEEALYSRQSARPGAAEEAGLGED